MQRARQPPACTAVSTNLLLSRALKTLIPKSWLCAAASLPAQHVATRPRGASQPHGVCLEHVRSMWLVAGKGAERQRCECPASPRQAFSIYYRWQIMLCSRARTRRQLLWQLPRLYLPQAGHSACRAHNACMQPSACLAGLRSQYFLPTRCRQPRALCA